MFLPAQVPLGAIGPGEFFVRPTVSAGRLALSAAARGEAASIAAQLMSKGLVPKEGKGSSLGAASLIYGGYLPNWELQVGGCCEERLGEGVMGLPAQLRVAGGGVEGGGWG